MKCARCGKETNCWITSIFNTEDICMDCKKKEEQHPLYKKARDAEHEAVMNGDYNFPGIGKPADL